MKKEMIGRLGRRRHGERRTTSEVSVDEVASRVRGRDRASISYHVMTVDTHAHCGRTTWDIHRMYRTRLKMPMELGKSKVVGSV